MDQDCGIGQLITNMVMVGDDQFETQALGQCRFFDAADSAINRDEQALRVFLMEFGNRFGIDSVAFFQPAWNVIVNGGSGQLQAVPQQAGGGDTIDVIVTINRNAPPCL